MLFSTGVHIIYYIYINFLYKNFVISIDSMVRRAHGERIDADGTLPPPRVLPRTIWKLSSVLKKKR